MNRSKEGIGKRFSASIPECVSTVEILNVGGDSSPRVRLPELRDRQTTVIFHCGSLDEDDYVEVIAPAAPPLVGPPKQGKKRYTLAELLEGSDEMAALNREAASWDLDPPVGNELL